MGVGRDQGLDTAQDTGQSRGLGANDDPVGFYRLLGGVAEKMRMNTLRCLNALVGFDQTQALSAQTLQSLRLDQAAELDRARA